jgi:light-regulated signal transduction histidine kinase (bacteriophytochrome)
MNKMTKSDGLTITSKVLPSQKRETEIELINQEFSVNGDVSNSELNAELEQKILDLTTQLENSNKDLEAFTYSVSHDLKAPLRAINGYAKILQEEHTQSLDNDGVNSLNAIIRNSKIMGDLIDNLLAFSRLGRKVVSISEINMNSLVKSVINKVTAKNSPSTIFTLNELLPAKGQQALIKQVWASLISNAIKFSRNNKTVKIEIGSQAKDDQVIYFVKDNGVGFNMQYYPKLFGIFQRLHSHDEYEGTGISLAITKKIVTNHNGNVWAESVLNEGSCFFFSLPKIIA